MAAQEKHEGQHPLAEGAVETDFEAVARVSKHIRLTGIRLVSIHANAQPDPGDLPSDWTDHAFVGFYAIPNSSSEATPIPEPFAGDLSIQAMFVMAFEEGRDPEEAGLASYGGEGRPALIIDAEFELAYAAEPGITFAPADIHQFALTNGIFHAWPYWRELVQSLCQRMGLRQTLVVPPFRVESGPTAEA